MAKAKKKEEAMVPKGETGMAEYDYGKYAGGGFEGQSDEDYTLPWLVVLQSGSPQVDPEKKHEDFPDAKAGMFFNTATEELYEEVYAVPSITEHVFTEWKPDRGGFLGKHARNSDIVKIAKKASEKFGKYATEDGNDLTEGFNIFWTLYDPSTDEVIGQVVLACTSTKITPYKAWVSKLRRFQLLDAKGNKLTPPPLFAHRVKLTTEKEKRPQGVSYNIVFRPAIDNNIKASLVPTSSPLFQVAEAFKELILSGDAKIDYNKSQSGGEGEDDSFEPGNF